MMTGTLLVSSRIRWRTWTPSSPGMRTSKRTRSARPPRTAISASTQLVAASTAYHVAIPAAEPVAQGIRDRAESVGIQPVDPAGDHGDPVDLARRLDQVLGARAREPRLELRQLLLERALLLEQLLEPLGDVQGPDLQELRRFAKRRLLFRDALERGGPRDGFDPAHAGGDRALGGNLEDADLPGLVQMSPAA